MQYALLNHYDETATAGLPPEVLQATMGAFIAFTQAMDAAGILRGRGQLQPTATATTVQVRDGERLVTDGPFAETREVFGGWWVVDVPDLDSAPDWAATCPGAAHGTIEVRPLVDLGRG